MDLRGPDGLLSQVIRSGAGAGTAKEMTSHLGYVKHDPASRGRDSNGSTPKTVLTNIGAVDRQAPRDQVGSTGPQIVRKGQTYLAGFSERIIALRKSPPR